MAEIVQDQDGSAGIVSDAAPCRVVSRRFLLALPAALAACAPGSFLPESGPTRGEIAREASVRVGTDAGTKVAYVLVDVTPGVIARLGGAPAPARFTDFGSREAPGTIGVGDVLGITIFEADSGGLFLPRDPGTRTGNFVTLPQQQVDEAGRITIPYGGTVVAAGLTPVALAQVIDGRFGPRALEPQTIVTVIEHNAAPVNVLGDVARATQFSLGPGGERVLGAIARAGGPRSPAYETTVRLVRGGVTQTALLSEIARDPTQNLELQPGDTILLARRPDYFLALGATGQGTTLGPVDRRLAFQDSRLTLADALGRAGGLQDDRADARAIFVYREETRAAVSALGVSTNGLPALIPTVYVVNLISGGGLFEASRFWMHPNDVIYIANAPATDLAKFLALVIAGSGSTAAIRATVN